MNTPWSTTPWRRVLVYGLGRSGAAAARLLAAREVEVLGYDDAAAPDALAALPGFQRYEGAALPAGLDGVVVSPGVPPGRPLLTAAREAGLPVIGEVELAFPFLDGPVVSITGSNGKSTTTAMTGSMLRGAGRPVEVCGNIGRPLTDCVEGPAGRVFVVELSSFQLETLVTYRSQAAAFLNLAPDHLDRYEGMAAYRRAKERIFARQRGEDVAVLNADDAATAGLPVPARRRSFSCRGRVEDGCYLEGDRVVEVSAEGGAEELFHRADVPLPGTHNLENAMAAALLARALGVPADAPQRGLAGFEALPHRLARVAASAGVTWFDDSKATNPDAAVRALEGFPENGVHLILGGRNKGADFRGLRDAVTRHARRVYLIGEAAPELAAALAGTVPCEDCGDLERAVTVAAARARAGEVVLLAPACASFDQYTGYAERGEHFVRLVDRLTAATAGGEG